MEKKLHHTRGQKWGYTCLRNKEVELKDKNGELVATIFTWPPTLNGKMAVLNWFPYPLKEVTVDKTKNIYSSKDYSQFVYMIWPHYTNLHFNCLYFVIK